MPNPTLDIDQLRRQFPEEIVKYFDAVVTAKFAAIESQVAQLQEAMAGVDQQINSAAQQAAEQAEARFEALTFEQFLALLQPEIDEYISEGVFDARTGARYQFYIDTQENISSLADREDNIIYIGKESS